MNNLDTFHIAAVQCDIYWENREANLNHLGQLMRNLSNAPVDLVILPEMFNTGFTMNVTQCSEGTEDVTLTWMRRQSYSLNAAITGSIIIENGDRYYNRLYFVTPDGNYKVYDKRHTFSYAGESEVFTRGEKKLIVNYKGWKICPLICYDLRFPVWSRNTEEVDILIYVANWPDSRIHAWDTLLPARAIENLCYTIGVNRVGVDGSQIDYLGHTAFYDPLGRRFAELKGGKEGIVIGTLEKNDLEKIRHRFRFLDDQDEFFIDCGV